MLVTIIRSLHYHHSIAPSVAQELVERIDIAIIGVCLPVSESDTRGRVVVIIGAGGGGSPEAVVLLDALGLKMEAADGMILLDEDVVKANDYSQKASDLFF